MQSFELRNESKQMLTWEIPSFVVERAKQSNNGSDLLAIAPMQGVLLPHACVHVHVCLSPARAEKYLIPIDVLYRKTQSLTETSTEEAEDKTLSFCLSTTGFAENTGCMYSLPKLASGKEEEIEADFSLPLSTAANADVPLALSAKLTRERMAFSPQPFRLAAASLPRSCCLSLRCVRCL